MASGSSGRQAAIQSEPGRLLRNLGLPPVTAGAPHVRDALELDDIFIWTLLALTPSILLGVYNTGLQANGSHVRLALEAAPGWRAAILDALSLTKDPGDLLSCLCHGVLYFLPALVVSLCLAWFWQILFAQMRGRATSNNFLITAIIFTLLLPPTAPLWQVALGISFGVILGQEVFGGIGKNFLNPALTGLVFLHLAYSGALGDTLLWNGIAGYSGTTIFSGIAAAGEQAIEQAGLTPGRSFLGLVQGSLGGTSALAASLGGLLLIRLHLISWRIIAGVLAGALGTLFVFRLTESGSGALLALPWYWHFTLGSLAFGATFLATDPVTSAITNPGRWGYGILIGFMVILIRTKNPLHPDGVILAVLLGNVFAPLIDSFFVWLNVRRRRHVL